MKRITLLIALLSTITIYGQHKIASRIQQLTEAKTNFTGIKPFRVSNKPDTAASVANNATFATLNERVLQHIFTNKNTYIELAVPYNGSTINVLLYRVEVLAKDFHVDTDKGANVPHTNGIFYRGIIKGDTNSVASFSFFQNEMSGIISAPGIGNIVVGRLQRGGNLSNYIIYNDTKLTIPFSFKCGFTDNSTLPDFQGRSTQSTLSERCVTVYFELDYDSFLDNGEDVDAATNWITGIFNNVQTLFENEGVTTALKSVYVWTIPDPYSGEASYDYLNQFYFTRPIFDGDVGQLITTNGGGLGGVAGGIGSLCSDTNISFSDVFYNYEDVPLFSWTVQVITHELGHVYGSPHTHGCYWNGNNTSIDGCGTTAGFIEGDCEVGEIPENQGTIMSYCHLIDGVGINFANGFGEQPATRILNHVESSLCLSTDCVSTCFNTVTTVAVTNSTLDSATITWQDENAGPWEVGYASANGTVVNYREVTTNTVTISDLNPNTYYKFSIRPVCSENISAEYLAFNFATSADWCSGALFTDTGGETNNYRDNQHIIRTIKPAAGQTFTVEFYTFELEQDYDYLYVYDGPDTNAPLLGVYTGFDYPGPFESTAEDASLTFEFRSDIGVTEAGWSAGVLCTLSTKESTFANLEYYPNPTNSNVTVTSPEGITGITIYNVAGQLLLNKTVNGTAADADIASFANGIYFFKVTNGNKTSNFRIIKQ